MAVAVAAHAAAASREAASREVVIFFTYYFLFNIYSYMTCFHVTRPCLVRIYLSFRLPVGSIFGDS